MQNETNHPLLPFFKKIPLFVSLEAEELNDILRGIQPLSLKKGQVIFSEGEPGDGAYIVESGTVEVRVSMISGDQALVASLGSGEVIGELALIDGAHRNATVVAAEDTSLLRIDRGEFDYLRRNCRPAAFKLTRAIARVVCGRLRETNDQIADIVGGDTEEKSDPLSVEQRSAGLISKLRFWRKS